MSAPAWLRVGMLAVTLTVCAGTAHGQPRTTPQPDGDPDTVERGPALPLPPMVQSVPRLAQPKAEAPQEAPTAGGLEISLLYEIITTAVIILFCAGGVLALSVTANYVIRMTRPTDPVELALRDPWVRANQARLNLARAKQRDKETRKQEDKETEKQEEQDPKP